ncbi:TMV resistance protein N, partial [Mucuna pruriens]
KLTYVNLDDCESLIELPHFGEGINLEILSLKGCIKLKKINPSIGLLRKLTFLNLEDCKSLIKLPRFGEDLNLETLNLKGCVQLRQIHPSIGLLRKLTFFNLTDCIKLVNLPNDIFWLNSIEYLSLADCSKVQLLEEQRDAKHLKKLCIGEAPIPSSQSTSSRAHKDSVSCSSPSLPTFPCMRHLDLRFCKLHQIPDAIGNLRCLESLNLMGNSFATLPSLKELSKLYYLNLQHCKQLKYLPELPSLTDLSSEFYKPPDVDMEPQVWQIDGPRLCVSIEPVGELSEMGLYIFNCPKLVERERCSSMTTSWMRQIIQADHQYKRLEIISWPPSIRSIIPGSEIPRWLNNQHVGSCDFITIDTSTPNNDCIGLLCCAVFATPYGRGTYLRKGPPEINVLYHISIPVVLREDLVMDKSDHLLLFYFTPTHPTLSQVTPSKMEIAIKNEEGFYFKVKKYGYLWVFKQDLELSDLMMHRSSVQADLVTISWQSRFGGIERFGTIRPDKEVQYKQL